MYACSFMPVYMYIYLYIHIYIYTFVDPTSSGLAEVLLSAVVLLAFATNVETFKEAGTGANFSSYVFCM